MKFRFIFQAFGLFLFLGAPVAIGQSCGVGTDAEIVLMLDRTGSMEPSDIAEEKEAAFEFIRFFENAQARPRIALGSFHSLSVPGYAQEGYENLYLYNGVEYSHARIHHQLTTDYEELYPLLSNSTTIPLWGNGGTNIAQMIRVGETELLERGDPSKRRILIALTDGEPSQPGWYTYPCHPDPCNCTPAVDFATSSASIARSNGVEIFTIYYGGAGSGRYDCEAEGIKLLKEEIVSAPVSSHFVDGNSALSEVFVALAGQLSCDDGKSCTEDRCEGNQCVFIEKDSDQDGISDCDFYRCETYDQSPKLTKLDQGVKKQEALILWLVKKLGLGTFTTLDQHQISSVLDEAHRLQIEGWVLSWQFPQFPTTCEIRTGCEVRESYDTKSNYILKSRGLLKLSRGVARKLENILASRDGQLGMHQEGILGRFTKKAKKLFRKNLRVLKRVKIVDMECHV